MQEKDHTQEQVIDSLYYKDSDSEQIDILALLNILWKGKWLLICVCFVFLLIGVGVALYLPNKYKATVIVQPVETENNLGLSSLASKFGGLASLAGVNIGTDGASDSRIALDIIKTWSYADRFIKNNNIQVPLFAADGWDRESNNLLIDENLYDNVNKIWVREPPKGKTIEPTSWELFEEYDDKLTIKPTGDSGLVEISFTHYSPYIAKEWLELLVADVNTYMKAKALEETYGRIQYLEEKIGETSIAEIRAAFSELIQEQYKNAMLAEVTDEYVFKVVSEAQVPEEKDSPKRVIIIAIFFILGAMFGMIYLITRAFFKNK